MGERMNMLRVGFVAVIGVAACGGSVVEEGSGGAGGTATSSTGAGATTTGTVGTGTTGTGAATTGSGGGTSTGPCPASPPTGTSCAGVPDQFQCTYGESVRPDCRTSSICDNGTWETAGGECIGPADCGSVEPGSQTVCTNMGDVCTYSESICYCGCGGGPACVSPIDWKCAAPPTTPGCPAIAPNDGTPCTAAGVECTYGTPCTPSNAVVSCTNGLWLWNRMIACAL